MPATPSVCSDGCSDGVVDSEDCRALPRDMDVVDLGGGNNGGRPCPSVSWPSTAAAVYPDIVGTRDPVWAEC